MDRTASILVVEDECVNAALIEHQLLKLGYRVSGVASTGEDAIRMAEAKRPDLVLMDIGLAGDLDGVETATVMRSKGLPVIFLTGNSDDQTIERARETDAHAYLHKPCQPRELHSSLQMALSRAEMEARIWEEKKWLSTTLNCIRDGVIAADATGVVKLMNATAERLTGWQSKDAMGNDLAFVFRVLQPDTGDLAECAVVQVLREGSHAGSASRKLLVSREGIETLIEERAASIDNESGVMIGVVLVFHAV